MRDREEGGQAQTISRSGTITKVRVVIVVVVLAVVAAASPRVALMAAISRGGSGGRGTPPSVVSFGEVILTT